MVLHYGSRHAFSRFAYAYAPSIYIHAHDTISKMYYRSLAPGAPPFHYRADRYIFLQSAAGFRSHFCRR